MYAASPVLNEMSVEDQRKYSAYLSIMYDMVFGICVTKIRQADGNVT